MKQMPVKIKNKLRQIQATIEKAKMLERELTNMFEEYDIDISVLDATGDNKYSSEPSTEALAFISNGEGYVEDNIKEIEEVFLYYVNKSK